MVNLHQYFSNNLAKDEGGNSKLNSAIKDLEESTVPLAL